MPPPSSGEPPPRSGAEKDRRLLALASEHTRGSSKRHSFQMRAGGKTQPRRLGSVRRESQPVTGSSLKRLNNSRAIMAATRSIIANGRRRRRRRVASRGSTAAVFSFTMKRLGWWEYRASACSSSSSAGASHGQDDSPLIHLASGSWVWNSALNRSSTANLVSLPGWLSTARAKAERQENKP